MNITELTEKDLNTASAKRYGKDAICLALSIANLVNVYETKHTHLAGDCALAKLNILKGQPRRNPNYVRKLV